MARLERDREDLMREATALVRRFELQLPSRSPSGQPQTWIVGFRRGGEASVFVGADPVFQFNAAGELRRGFWNGRLVKAERGRLVQLERRRAAAATQLVRHLLPDMQAAEFLQLADETRNLLLQALSSGDLVVVNQVPDDLDVVHQLADWLNSLPRPLKIAVAPNVRS